MPAVDETRLSATRSPRMTSVVLTEDESSHLEWFKCATAVKLPGVFATPFWDSVLFQACVEEVAVLHAILALGSAHKIDSGYVDHLMMSEQEQFTLRQYNKSIRHLRTLLADPCKKSLEVALVTCVVFICLDYIRGHYTTGSTHLKCGARLLRSSVMQAQEEHIDDSIVEMFSRLCVQTDLFGQLDRPILLHSVVLELPTTQFRNTNEARHHLDKLLNRVLQQMKDHRHGRITSPSLEETQSIYRQKRIRADLDSWLKLYKASADGHCHTGVRDKFAMRVLRMYHTLAVIMNDTSLAYPCEMDYDSHIDGFKSLIEDDLELHKAVSVPSTLLSIMPGLEEKKPGSISDWGGTPPMYYTALKCRNYHLRMQAIGLIERFPHKEGIWDSSLAASIAREVVRLEGTSRCGDLESSRDSDANGVVNLRKLSELASLPSCRRMFEVCIRLPNDEGGEVRMICKRMLDNGVVDVVHRSYDLISRRWKDGKAKGDERQD